MNLKQKLLILISVLIVLLLSVLIFNRIQRLNFTYILPEATAGETQMKEIEANLNITISASKNNTVSPTNNKTPAPAETITPTTINKADFVASLEGARDSEQLIIVIGTGGYGADFGFYEKKNNRWQETLFSKAGVGFNGIADLKSEGDGKTPGGSFPISFAFGIGDNPGINLMEYRKVTEKDYWSSDIKDGTYNTWVTVEHDKLPPDGEHLIEYRDSYKYALAIGYNLNCEEGKGSAIFMHILTGKSTLGCVGISEKDLLVIMRSLDSSKNPKIIIVPDKAQLH